MAGGGGSGGACLGLRQDRTQANIINHLPAGAGQPNMGAELGLLLAKACAGGSIRGPELLWGGEQFATSARAADDRNAAESSAYTYSHYVCGIFASCMCSAPLGGLLPCAAYCVVGLRW